MDKWTTYIHIMGYYSAMKRNNYHSQSSMEESQKHSKAK